MISTLKQNFVLFFLILTIGFSCGFWIGKGQITYPILSPDNVDLSLFWEAWNVVREKYEGRKDLDVNKMIEGAIDGMVNSLEDPYTVFFTPDEVEAFLEDVKGTFEGVGMEVAIKNNQLQVVSPLEGTPAAEAGLKPGDKILEIDGRLTTDIPVDEVTDLIRGPKGTEVVLTVFRDSWEEEREIKLIRRVINVPALKMEIMPDNIAYLRLYQFSQKASSEFSAAAKEILSSSVEGIILDLRNNPGGYLPVAQSIAGWFLPEGQVVALEDFGQGQERQEVLSSGKADLAAYPLVVLMDQGSASGSEILAGALRDNKGTILVGETSFGKGLVQELVSMQDGFAIKVTVAKWLTPKGECINDKGLEPDVAIEITQEDYDNNRDPQMEKAIEIIKGLE
jgi:carboxyl-terminal processing protease